MSELRAIAQAYMDRTGAREAAIARLMDVPAQTLNSWWQRPIKQLPQKHLLLAFARVTQVDYEVVLDAALRDTRYLPREAGETGGDAAPTKEDVALAARDVTREEQEPGTGV